MSIEDFITWAFCFIDDAVAEIEKKYSLITRGFAPKLSDSEVITMELVGEYLSVDADKCIWEYFKMHWAKLFPCIGARSSFVKQAANLWWVKQKIHERLIY